MFSDDRYRGVSLSDGRPVGILDLSYDAANGMYATISGSVVATRDEGVKGLGLVLNGGYARRLQRGLTLDMGIVHSRYSQYSGVLSSRRYTEIYAGLSGKVLGARFSVSPNYLGAVKWAVHGEVDAHLDLSRNTYLDGTVGALVPLGRRAYQGSFRTQVDARVGLAQRLGPVSLHVAVSGRTGSTAVYGVRGPRRVALILGVSSTL